MTAIANSEAEWPRCANTARPRLLFRLRSAFEAGQIGADRLGDVAPHGVIMVLDALHDVAALVEKHCSAGRTFGRKLDDQRVRVEPVARAVAAVDDRADAAAEN